MSNLFTVVSAEQQEIVAGGRGRRGNSYSNKQVFEENTYVTLSQTAGRNGPATHVKFTRDIWSKNDLILSGPFLGNIVR